MRFIKITFLSIFILSIFIFSKNDVLASPLEYQTGIQIGQGTIGYRAVRTSGAASVFYQQINPKEICMIRRKDTNCEINKIEAYLNPRSNLNTATGFELYEADILPVSRATLGTKIKDFIYTIPMGTELFHLEEDFNNIILDQNKFYTLVLKSSSADGFDQFRIPYYDAYNVPNHFTKYYNINDTFPSWRNWNYDMVVYFSLDKSRINLNDYDENITTYDFNLDIFEPDFSTVNSQTCVIGEECRLWFSFNDLAIGYNMYLTLYEGITSPSYAIASTTVEQNYFWQNYLIVPDVEEEAEIKYNLLLDAGEYGYIGQTGIKINWLLGSTWDEIIGKTGADLDEYCNASTICAGISGNANTFLYGVQCGMRQTACYIFAPTAKSKEYISKSVSALEGSFPFNMYFDFINKTSNVLSQEMENKADILSVPFINGEGDFIMLPVVSSSTMPNALGSSFNTFKNGLQSLVWLIMGVLIAFITYKTLW